MASALKLDGRFSEAQFFVETPDREVVKFLRWFWTGTLVNADESLRLPKKALLTSWEDDPYDITLAIGETSVTWWFAKLNGHTVCFFEPTSVFVNRAMVRAFIAALSGATIVTSEKFASVVAAIVAK